MDIRIVRISASIIQRKRLKRLMKNDLTAKGMF